MNSKCPNCGSQLVADVKLRTNSVPLRDDGYFPEQGDWAWAELLNIRCTKCGCEVSPKYYYEAESKLKTAVRAAVTKGEKDD